MKRTIENMATRLSICLLILNFAGGCIQPTGGVVVNPDRSSKKIVSDVDAEIEKATFEASQKRDAIGADLLVKLADEIKAMRESGETLHDGWLMQRIGEANTKSAVDAGQELSVKLGVKLNAGAKLDSVSAEKAVRGMASGKLRASK